MTIISCFIPVEKRRAVEDALWEYLTSINPSNAERPIKTVPVWCDEFSAYHPSFEDRDIVPVQAIIRRIVKNEV